MSRQLTIPGSELEIAVGPALLAVRRAAEAAAARVNDPHAKNTSKAYKRAWDAWGNWCDEQGIDPLPAGPTELTTYLEWLSRGGRAPNGVRAALTAIASLDGWMRTTPSDPHPTSVRKSPSVQRWLKSWGRDNPRAPKRRAASIEESGMRKLLDVINEPSPSCARAQHVLRATRDRAMLLVGIYGGLRVSELAALTTADLRFVDRGLELALVRSKTDQEGEGTWKGLLPATDPALCAVNAWRMWLAARGEWRGPAFIAIQRNGTVEGSHLTTRTIQRLVTDYARRAGLELVSSHSMRATLATRASERGHRIEVVARHLGHKSLQTTAGYMDRGSLFDERNPTAGLFDGPDR